jgi:hypothetical protein
MRGIPRKRPSPALIVAVIALIAASSGAAVALPGKNSVKSNDIAKNQIKSSHIKKANVKSSDLKKNGVKGSKVANESLSEKDIGDYGLLGKSPVKVGATEAVSFAAARAAAPETPLWADTTVEVYAKCLYDTTAGDIQGEMYVRTSEDGAMMEGNDDLPGTTNGTTFLNVATPEEDRQLDIQLSTAPNAAGYNENEGLITSADGHAYHVLTNIGVKQGAPAGGNGPFGAGNVCLFHGSIFG